MIKRGTGSTFSDMTDNQDNLLLELSKTADIDSGNLAFASESVLRTASLGLGTQRASIWLSQVDHIQCHMLYENNAVVPDIELALWRSDFPAYFAALETERAIIASDAETHPATYEFTESYLRPLSIK
jgi:two-component system NtrC family sensor kinase